MDDKNIIWDLEQRGFSLSGLECACINASHSRNKKVDIINIDEQTMFDIMKYVDFYHKFDKCNVSIKTTEEA